MSEPVLVGFAPGPPLDPTTWSGTSRHLFLALGRAGFDVRPVDTTPGRAVDVLARATTVHPERSSWRARYHLSGVAGAAAGKAARRRAAAIAPDPDVLLQIGAWHGVSRRRRGHALACSYHDGNLAVHARSGHLDLDNRSRFVRRRMAAERRIYDGLDIIFTMSEWLRSSFIEDFGQDPAKVVTVGGGPNLDRAPDPVERDWTRPTFLFVGKDFERKGGPDVVAALATVRASRPQARLVVVGPPRPPAPAPGVEYVSEISRSDPGGEAELGRLFAEATAFVMPSRFEPFGIAFVEAMAWGLPCIASRACAMPEIVRDGETGIIVAPGDRSELAAAMTALAADPDRARAMGEASRARQRANLAWDVVAGSIRATVLSRLAHR